MKLKYIIFTTIIMLLVLLVGATDVNAEYTTHFYELDRNNSEWNIGDSANFQLANWYESYNMFCTEAGADTPTNFTVYNKMYCDDGKVMQWLGEEGKYTDEQIIKFLYIYSTLSDEIAQGNIAGRNNNWEAVQQHAIWDILGQENLKPGAQAYKAKYKEDIKQLLANANAYYEFWKNNGADVETSIDTSKVKFENGNLGPFVINYKEYEVEKNNAIGKYGEITKIELLYVDENGETTKSLDCYDCSSGSFGNLDKEPESGAEIYINGIEDVANYNTIKVTFNNQNIKGYLIFGNSNNSEEQSSMFGSADRHTTTKQEKFELKDEFAFKLLKTDSETGEGIPNVKFYLISADTDIITYTTNSFGEVDIPVVVMGGKTEVVLNIHEEAPQGYKALGYGIQVVFKNENDKWICSKIARLMQGSNNLEVIYENGENVLDGELVTFIPNNSEDNMVGTLSIKNEPEDAENIELTIRKIDADNKKKQLSGAEFSISVQNRNSR